VNANSKFAHIAKLNSDPTGEETTSCHTEDGPLLTKTKFSFQTLMNKQYFRKAGLNNIVRNTFPPYVHT
jgi:hypothetical protein